MLALTILYKTIDVGRFQGVRDYISYCRQAKRSHPDIARYAQK